SPPNGAVARPPVSPSFPGCRLSGKGHLERRGFMAKNYAAAALLAAFPAAAGLVPSDACADPASVHVSEDGYTAVDADQVWDEINAALAPNPESVFRPAATIGPMPVALAALEASEPALDRVRYRLRYATAWVDSSPGGVPHPVSYIEVLRFNLGPA